MVFFHSPGTFETARKRTYLRIGIGRKFTVDLAHEEYHMLDFGGEKCTKTKSIEENSQDLCTHERLEKKALETYIMPLLIYCLGFYRGVCFYRLPYAKGNDFV